MAINPCIFGIYADAYFIGYIFFPRTVKNCWNNLCQPGHKTDTFVLESRICKVSYKIYFFMLDTKIPA